jgi:putative acetyltransferase
LQKLAVDAHCGVPDVKGDNQSTGEKGMSDIVIRHAQPDDVEALRQLNAQPEVYHDTLQIPHPQWKCGRSD